MVGCKFLILGDFDGQLLPITAGTDDFDYDKLADSDFMHDLCNGLRIDLTEYRRGKDQEHFKFMQKLYNRERSLKPCITAAMRQYQRSERASLRLGSVPWEADAAESQDEHTPRKWPHRHNAIGAARGQERLHGELAPNDANLARHETPGVCQGA